MKLRTRAPTHVHHLVLREAASALEDDEIDFVAIGSIAGTVYGAANWDREDGDIDLMVREEDGRRAQRVLAAAGFEPKDPPETWLLKASKHDVTVDLIFEMFGGIRMDDEMLARARRAEVAGVSLLVIPPEEYALAQAISARPVTPEHWYNGFTSLRDSRTDWEAYERRASWNPDRALAMALFARSGGVAVPDDLVRRLAQRIHA